MTSKHVRAASASHRRLPVWAWIIGGFMAVSVITLLVRNLGMGTSGAATVGASLGGDDVLLLALPAFLAGVLSFLSPCCLPILSSYFAVTFQARRERIVLMTVAFFLGLATTLVVLGATATAMTRLLVAYLPALTTFGGVLIIGFGILSLLGKGFSGVQLLDRPQASVAGSYLYGATFALGWSACVGPILGAILTLLATQGVAVLGGALLAFIYALGVGAPLMVTAAFFSRIGTGTRAWRILRGRGFSLNLGFTALHLHTTSIASGVLLIVMGWLLATGQINVFSRWALQTPLTQWVLSLDHEIKNLFVGP